MVSKKTLLAVGVLATIGVTGLAFMYRREIMLYLTGTNPLRIKTTAKALDEFKKWNKEGKPIKEHDAKTVDNLEKYWESVGLTYKGMKTQPWSAAFISYVMKSSGAGEAFKYAPSHSTYILAAIQNATKKTGRVKGFRAEDVPVKIGDIVCYPRNGSTAGYNTTSGYESHCDICVSIDKKKNQAVTIGGNVSDSVSKTTVPLTKDGKIDKSKTNKDYFVVIKY